MKNSHSALAPCSRIFIFCIVFLFFETVANAQIVFPGPAPSINDDAHANSTCAVNTTINADLYSASGGNQFLVIVYDGFAGTNAAQLLLIDRFNSGLQVALPVNALHPDVVIGDNPGGSAGDVIVSVVYEQGPDVMYDAYSVTGIGTISLTSTQVGGMPVKLSSTSATAAQYPHIDMAPDPSGTPVNGNFPLHDYVVTWAEGGGTYDAVAYKGNLLTPPAPSPATQMIQTGAALSDIALTTNTAFPYTQTAYFITHVPVGPTGDMFHSDWDVSTTTVNTNLLENNVGVTGCPRIEAANLTTSAIMATDVNWAAVAEINNIFQEIHAYDQTGTTTSLTNYSTISVTGIVSNPLAASNGISPAIGCGNGQATAATATDIGNDTYTMGWYIDYSGYEAFYGMSLDIFGAGPSGYAQINTGAATGFGGNRQALAITNASNDGYDLATAWYNPLGTICWKFSGNTFAFKTTSVTEAFDVYAPIVSPNPATDKLYVANLPSATYSLMSMTGQVLQCGAVTETERMIDIALLPQGTYYLCFTSQDKVYNTRFVKQ